MKSYFWSGISRDDRLKAIDEIAGIADRYATIINFQRFSDLSLSLILAVEECKLIELQASLKKIMSLGGIDAEPSDSKTESIVLLNITFTKGTGDLKIEVPDMPE
ncbi:MAG: hypothetical protein WCI92_16485 [Bacteroidota bacterium]